MADPMYPEFMLEMGMDTLVKQEQTSPVTSGANQETSASVPIPGGPHRGSRGGVYDQFSPSPLTNPAIWGGRPDLMESPFKLEILDPPLDPLAPSFKMEDDDIFQVDKADLIQGPTLAELNANDDTIFGDLNFDDLLLPDENIQSMRQDFDMLPGTNSFLGTNSGSTTPSSFPQQNQLLRGCSLPYTNSFQGNNSLIDHGEGLSPAYSPVLRNIGVNVDSSTASSSTSPHPVMRPLGQSTLHELLMKKGDIHSSPAHSQMDIGFGGSSAPKISRLSISAPSQSMGLEQIWARREARPHLLSTGSLVVTEGGSTSSLSTGSALSPNPLGLLETKDPASHDECYEDSDDDSDHYDDYSSDGTGSDEEAGTPKEGSSARDMKQKKEKFFWQYNVQAKGPKGQRLVARARLENPHVLHEVTDPVFSPNCALRGIKHSGKARKGDGNDLTPNPKKLHSIGKELDKLSRVINDMTPVSELPFPIRPKTRKEKNKLASRACRLKKKAQHEANKIKLHGLEIEHKRLIQGIAQAKQILAAKVNEANPENQQELTRQMEKVAKQATKVKIANHSTEFVNKILDKIKAGVPDGGLEDF